MAIDLKQTSKPDEARISVEQDYELNDWAKKLGLSPDQLRKAIQAVGPKRWAHVLLRTGTRVLRAARPAIALGTG